MKRIIIPALFAFFLLSGCSDARNVGEKTAKKVLELPDKSEVISDLVKIRNSVNMFYMQKGYFPESLDELNLDLYCPLEDFNYNLENGTVNHKDYSQL